jgi:hypothetical protein
MSDPIDIQLFASQREFDELQAALVENLPDFRLYLSANNPNERRQYEQDLSIRPEFQRWQALAAKIAALYAGNFLFPAMLTMRPYSPNSIGLGITMRASACSLAIAANALKKSSGPIAGTS